MLHYHYLPRQVDSHRDQKSLANLSSTSELHAWMCTYGVASVHEHFSIEATVLAGHRDLYNIRRVVLDRDWIYLD
jgi:hypothetical protein